MEKGTWCGQGCCSGMGRCESKGKEKQRSPFLLPSSSFHFSVSPGSRSGIFFPETAVQIPKYSRTKLVLHHICSVSPSQEQCSVAVGKAERCSNGLRAFLQRYSKVRVSLWIFIVAVEWVKPTYSLNAFMAFHCGSYLFTWDKSADMFSSSVFLLLQWNSTCSNLQSFWSLSMTLSILCMMPYFMLYLFLAFSVSTAQLQCIWCMSRILSDTMYFSSVITYI